MLQLRKAQRTKAKIRLGLFGPSGSGKTYTALLIASGMVPWNKIALIDTENHSGDLYSHLGPYNVISLDAPFTPSKYIEAIKACEAAGIELAIIDSITHEWNGKGGCLDMHEQFVRKMKMPNSFTAWGEITPQHQAFIDSILQSPMHIIATGRTKTEYVLTEKNGKQVPQKVGMKIESRDGFEYELTIALDLTTSHEAFASKDRTGLFKDPFVPSPETGLLINAWCGAGEAVEATTIPIASPAPVADPDLNDIEAALQKGDQSQQPAATTEPLPPAQPEPAGEPATGQQIAVVTSLMSNAVFSAAEKEAFIKRAKEKDKPGCQELIKRITAELQSRINNKGNNNAAA